MRSVLIVSLGVPIASVIFFEILILIFSIFNHSNVRLPAQFEKALSYIIVTPSIHWVHHHALRSDTDANYGTIFSFWDKMFHSFSSHQRELDMNIGVEGRKELSLFSLLLRPLKK